MKRRFQKPMRLLFSMLLSFALLSPLCCLSVCGQPPTVYRSVQTDTMKIALTFDDGPHPRLTHEILDILEGDLVHDHDHEAEVEPVSPGVVVFAVLLCAVTVALVIDLIKNKNRI